MRKTEYIVDIHAPIVRRRTVLEVEEGEVRAFCTQLEFNHAPESREPDEWEYIARFDHKPESVNGHDIRQEGLHIDIRDPRGDDKEYTHFPPVEPNRAPKYAENYFDERYLEICERYLSWCDEVRESWRAILPVRP